MQTRTRRNGFTLVEILIVVVILGILAAIVIPQFTSASESAKASSLTTQLQSIRSQLELYQINHNGNYPLTGVTATGGTGAATQWSALTEITDQFGAVSATGDYGPYLQKAPANPFTATANNTAVADEGGTADATVAWHYNATTGEIWAVLPVATANDTGLTDGASAGTVGDFVLY
ncbi:MAG: prepilin-type N-terminal cleavage/methylation domain-containing protein [Planctomycetota bacterium]